MLRDALFSALHQANLCWAVTWNPMPLRILLSLNPSWWSLGHENFTQNFCCCYYYPLADALQKQTPKETQFFLLTLTQRNVPCCLLIFNSLWVAVERLKRMDLSQNQRVFVHSFMLHSTSDTSNSKVLL